MTILSSYIIYISDMKYINKFIFIGFLNWNKYKYQITIKLILHFKFKNKINVLINLATKNLIISLHIL
jgi:hypothetical protein